jgi:hypothetical protein
MKMLKFGKWVAAHGMYLLTLVCSIIILAGVFSGRISLDVAMALTLGIITLFAADFRPRLERHQAEVRELLLVIAQAGKATASKNVPAAVEAGVVAVEDGAKLASEVEQEAKA